MALSPFLPKTKQMQKSLLLFLISLAILFQAAVAQENLSLAPMQDNTLFEDADGATSNGVGQYLFAGMTNGNEIRRALIKFDLSDIPAGATITEVTLTLNMNKTRASGAKNVSLHTVDRSWGEASSDAGGQEGRGTSAESGDATWTHAISDTDMWNSAGGDFNSTASATTAIDATGSYQWSSAELLQDVIDWYNDPGSNHGWILIGDESEDKTAMRFNSREASTNTPELAITYSVSTNLSLSALGIRLFPNPATDRVNLSFEGMTGMVTVELRNLHGQRFEGFQGSVSNEIELDISSLPNGIYLLNVQTDQGTAVERIIKR